MHYADARHARIEELTAAYIAAGMEPWKARTRAIVEAPPIVPPMLVPVLTPGTIERDENGMPTCIYLSSRR